MFSKNRRFTRDTNAQECSIGDKFKFTTTDPASGIPEYYQDRLCQIRYITLEKEVIYFFFCEPLRDRKIKTSVFNRCCQKYNPVPNSTGNMQLA